MKNVILALSGSIATYKSLEIIRLLQERNITVKCVMTEGAQRFVTPLSFEAISGSPVFSSLWSGAMDHIGLPQWGDILVCAPASADLLARLAHGHASCPVSSLFLATTTSVLIAPAMNTAMWNHPATQENVRLLISMGVGFIEPDSGLLACGTIGQGRLADPLHIVDRIEQKLFSRSPWNKLRVLVTAGATREPLDPARFLSNFSSGKMGVALAHEASKRGAATTLIHGHLSVPTPTTVKSVPISTASDLRNAVHEAAPHNEILFMNAAVSDIRPKKFTPSKRSKSELLTPLEVDENPDIVKEVVESRSGIVPLVVAFCVHTGSDDNLCMKMIEKFSSKKVDIIIGNLARDSFEKDTNRVWVYSQREPTPRLLSEGSKSQVASSILSYVEPWLL